MHSIEQGMGPRTVVLGPGIVASRPVLPRLLRPVRWGELSAEARAWLDPACGLPVEELEGLICAEIAAGLVRVLGLTWARDRGSWGDCGDGAGPVSEVVGELEGSGEAGPGSVAAAGGARERGWSLVRWAYAMGGVVREGDGGEPCVSGVGRWRGPLERALRDAEKVGDAGEASRIAGELASGDAEETRLRDALAQPGALQDVRAWLRGRD